jgi:hypothetical protein
MNMKKQLLLLCLLALAALTGNAMAQTGSPPPLRVYGLRLDDGTKTATAASGAATLNKASGVITTESLSTAAGSSYTLTLTNNQVAAADQPFVSVWLGTATAGTPVVTVTKPQAGSLVISVKNIDASAAFNGTLKIGFGIFKN